MYLHLITQVKVVFLLCGVGLAAPEAFPHFRHVDPLATIPNERPAGVITLLTDDDFAPFSYKDAKGTMVGIAVDMALQACAEVKLVCQLKPMDFSNLMSALGRGAVSISRGREAHNGTDPIPKTSHRTPST